MASSLASILPSLSSSIVPKMSLYWLGTLMMSSWLSEAFYSKLMCFSANLNAYSALVKNSDRSSVVLSPDVSISFSGSYIIS